MIKHNVAVMVIGDEKDDGALPVTQANLDGQVWTVTADNPALAEVPETLIEVVSARAPEHGAVLVHPGLISIPEWCERMRALDWKHGSPEEAERSGWVKFWRKGDHPVIVCKAADAVPGPLFGKRDTPDTIATRLSAFHRALGVPWYSTGALTGTIALTDLWGASREPYWSAKVGEEVISTPELEWRREPREEGRATVAWDGRRFGLNAAAQVKVPMDSLVFRREDFYDRDQRGYWRIHAAAVNAQVKHKFGEAFPDLIDASTIDDNGSAWVPSPLVDLAVEWGFTFDVFTVATSKRGWYGNPLRGWAWAIRDALEPFGDDRNDPVAKALKEVYARTPSMIGAPGGTVCRRDWRDAIEAHKIASVLRRVGKVHAGIPAGKLPNYINRDEIGYAVNFAEEIAAIEANIGVGDKIGNMKRVSR